MSRRTPAGRWTVQEWQDGTWVTRKEGCAFFSAVQFHDALPGVKRMLLDGRPLRIFNDSGDLFTDAG